MVNTLGVIRLFHHFHHDADDGLNDGTNALWALMGSGGIAAAIDMQQVNERQIGTPCDWLKMLAWNSTADVLVMINELVTTRSPAPRVDEDTSRADQSAPASKDRPRKSSAPRLGQAKTRKDRNDDNEPERSNETEADGTEDVMVVGFTMKPTVPVPAFIAAAIMESYATDPAELALTIVRAIKKRASDDPDPDRATALAEAASYVPRWIISNAINTRRTPGTAKRGV